MTTIQVTMPEDIEAKAEEVARQQRMSLDEFMTLALVEKLSAAVPDKYLEERARRGNRKAFDEFMSAVPDAPPDDYDTF